MYKKEAPFREKVREKGTGTLPQMEKEVSTILIQ
jgi:hypothetical protein